MNNVRENCDQGKFRHSVGIVLINKENKVFIGKRRVNSRYKDYWRMRRLWQMPQGGIEHNESPVAAVYRELMEEVGTDKADIISESRLWMKYTIPVNMRRKNSRFIGQKQKWFLLRFIGNDCDFDLESFSGIKEFDDWRWADVYSVINNSIYFKRQLYINVFKEFCEYFGMDERSICLPTKKKSHGCNEDCSLTKPSQCASLNDDKIICD